MGRDILFIFLVLLGVSLFILYFRGHVKTKAIGAFFASLSHRTKTPLASMRLQAEVIKDLIEDETHDHDQLSNLTTRLIEDTYKFEEVNLKRVFNLLVLSRARLLIYHQFKLGVLLNANNKDSSNLEVKIKARYKRSHGR